MPEMTLQVRWPDGILRQYYSPSLVLHDHLAPGTYRVDDFTTRACAGLREAGERVRATFGFACTSAAASSEAIVNDSRRHPASAEVVVVTMDPPLTEPSRETARQAQGAS
ncbi:MSMEG_0570 family nitrogen starvation response protein [Gordonia paraffinivorans]|uniref:MSMEG_0570 family nitrogen starvation response protein n=1 Tax=Gordonia paraffinivorans TaxID=175628 RepID=UPI003FCE3A1F